MGGSGSSSRGYWRQEQSISDDQINGFLRDKLRNYNDRDTEAISRHIRGLRDALEQSDDDFIRTRFGGSVSRHTYVNGLSDVDLLAILNDSTLSGLDPQKIIQHMAKLIRQRMPKTRVSTGNLAVTVTYADGNELQILPAIRTKSGIRIADPNSNRWSKVLHPERFAHKLTQVNQANNGQVIPAVKLTKALIDRSVRSDRDRISGYHLESLAINAFRNYRGPYDLSSMIRRLADYSVGAVKQPIKDSTGQSRHVDEYLGPARSPARHRAASTFKRINDSLDNCRSIGNLENLFDA